MRWVIASLIALQACTPIGAVSTQIKEQPADAAAPRDNDTQQAALPETRNEGGSGEAPGITTAPAAGSGEGGEAGAAGQPTATAGSSGAEGSPGASDDPTPVSCTPNAVFETQRGSLRLECDRALDLRGSPVAYLALPGGANPATAQRFTDLAISALVKKLKFTATITPSGINNAAGCNVDDCRTISEFRLSR